MESDGVMGNSGDGKMLLVFMYMRFLAEIREVGKNKFNDRNAKPSNST